MTTDKYNETLARLYSRTRNDVAEDVSRALRQQVGRNMHEALQSALTDMLWAQEQRLIELVAMTDFDRPMGVTPDEWIAHASPNAPIGRVVADTKAGEVATVELDPAYLSGAAIKVQDMYDALPTPIAAATRKPTARDLVRDAQRSSTNGKRVNAPCGHEGEVVIGSYARCLEGCDGEAVVVRDRAARRTQCLHRNTGLFHDPDNWSRTYGQRVRVCLDCKERL